jgi:hypothetical protein
MLTKGDHFQKYAPTLQNVCGVEIIHNRATYLGVRPPFVDHTQPIVTFLAAVKI